MNQRIQGCSEPNSKMTNSKWGRGQQKITWRQFGFCTFVKQFRTAFTQDPFLFTCTHVLQGKKDFSLWLPSELALGVFYLTIPVVLFLASDLERTLHKVLETCPSCNPEILGWVLLANSVLSGEAFLAC